MWDEHILLVLTDWQIQGPLFLRERKKGMSSLHFNMRLSIKLRELLETIKLRLSISECTRIDKKTHTFISPISGCGLGCSTACCRGIFSTGACIPRGCESKIGTCQGNSMRMKELTENELNVKLVSYLSSHSLPQRDPGTHRIGDKYYQLTLHTHPGVYLCPSAFCSMLGFNIVLFIDRFLNL
jgi:hypothetical protein